MLFVPGEFRSHAGEVLPWKIDCDALTNTEVDLFADLILQMVSGPVTAVVGIPRGGLRLAAAVRERLPPSNWADPRVLIVDDVLTTGGSMERERRGIPGGTVLGAVMFARGPCPNWVWPVFELHRYVRGAG